MTNLDIIKSTYEGKSSEENGKNLEKYAADDISWTEAKGFPYAGTYIGLASIAQNVFSRLANEWVDYKFTPDSYIASDDKVVALGTYSGTYQQTQQYFEARAAHVWQLKNSKIVQFEQFVDSATVCQSMK
ncbi:hypothetical protein DTO96_101323 [Ephemeroptericola cinctiostellae]|uniref:SnoaL-like domain-containing protein n=1 Tax=Ephemeroptericola cinctiostellae TaxID=2268024 RepID=A0A345DB54_9BURK|nr:nuclear transport factor 2 family protein [Ephemeroptericola cinctiostellae]AXF85592.1 hypothetical protein DTO96_101323 [Ephemeroptericola cinctiostellae]